MELETRLLTLPRAKQLEVVQRIFQQLALAYGRRVLDMWADMDMQDVYVDWADELQGCSIGAIKFAVATAKQDLLDRPPTQGQFLALCKKYRPTANNVHRIAHRLTPEELEANKKRIAEITAELARKKTSDRTAHCGN